MTVFKLIVNRAITCKSALHLDIHQYVKLHAFSLNASLVKKTEINYSEREGP